MADLKLKKCPCGAIPNKLAIVDAGQGCKWALAMGYCCSEWHIEFRTMYEPLGSEKCMELAIKAWNESPRGKM